MRIFNVIPFVPEVGDELTITGENFGSTRGTVVLLISGVIITCSIRSWSDGAINTSIPETAADIVGEAEKNVTIWVKEPGKNLGPYRNTRIRPKAERLIPVITSVYPDEVTPGQLVVVTGRNFLSRRGVVRFDFDNGLIHPGTIKEWSDNSVVIEMDPDLGGLRAQSCKMIVENRAGNSDDSTFNFVPAEQLILLTETHELSNLGDKAVGEDSDFGFDLINDWVVEESRREIVEVYGGHRFTYEQMPERGDTNCLMRFRYVVDDYSTLTINNYLTIKGPRGVPYYR